MCCLTSRQLNQLIVDYNVSVERKAVLQKYNKVDSKGFVLYWIWIFMFCHNTKSTEASKDQAQQNVSF